MMRRALLVSAAFLVAAPAWADAISQPGYTDAQAVAAAVASGQLVTSVNGLQGAVTTATLPGKFTVQSGGANPLPDPTANPGRYANAIDVGGVATGGGTGFAQLYSTGTCWKRTSPYVVPLVVQAATTISVVSLQQSPILQLAGSSYAGAAAINIVSACPGDVFTVMIPNGVFSLIGSPTLTLSVNGLTPLSMSGLTGGTWADYVYTGSAVQKIRGGTL